MKQVAKKLLSVVFALCLAVVGIVTTPTVKASAATTIKSYEKVTSAPTDWSGKYLIVCESSSVAFNGSLSTLDAANNNVAVTISNGTIEATETLNASVFTVEKSGDNYTIKSSSGKYIGNGSNSNALSSSTTEQYTNTITFTSADDITVMGSGGAYLRYNATSGQTRFRYFKSGTYTSQQAIQFYKAVEVEESSEATNIKEGLQNIESYMGLAYEYTKTTKAATETSTTDTLDRAFTGVTGNSYTDWSGKEGSSGAVYAGRSAGGNTSIQLNKTSPQGVVTTVSGGTAKKITVTWQSSTSNGRVLKIYGSNTAYKNAADLYSATPVGEIVKGTTVVYEFKEDYKYIGFRATSGAAYLTEVKIEWESKAAEGATETELSGSNFWIRCGIDANVSTIAGENSYAIRVTANNGTPVDLTPTATVTETIDGKSVSIAYVVIGLKDIVNDVEKLTTEFSVRVVVKVGEEECLSTKKTYSVAALVKEYYETEGITEVKELYDYLKANGAIR